LTSWLRGSHLLKKA